MSPCKSTCHCDAGVPCGACTNPPAQLQLTITGVDGGDPNCKSAWNGTFILDLAGEVNDDTCRWQMPGFIPGTIDYYEIDLSQAATVVEVKLFSGGVGAIVARWLSGGGGQECHELNEVGITSVQNLTACPSLSTSLADVLAL